MNYSAWWQAAKDRVLRDEFKLRDAVAHILIDRADLVAAFGKRTCYDGTYLAKE